MSLRSVPGMILDAIAPATCHCCGELLKREEKYLCGDCLRHLPPMAFRQDHDNPLVIKLAGRVNFENAAAAYIYEPGGKIASIIQDFKYRDFPGLARYLGELIARNLLNTGFFSDIDGVIPMPVHWTRRLRRGYNQVEMIAEGIGSVAGVPVVNVLRARFHRSQTSRNHEQRTQNVRGKYFCKEGARLRGRHFLLIDDVCTTGSTIITAAEALRSVAPDVRLSIATIGCTM